jgi:isochorismate synthase
MPTDFTVLDNLIRLDRSFAIYRIPGRSLVFLLQQEGRPESLEGLSGLNGRQGFVMAPFQATPDCPVVLIRPDRVLKGETAVFDYLEKTIPAFAASKDFSKVTAAPLHSRRFSGDSFASYKSAFELFQKALHAEVCHKIVLSRTCQRPRSSDFSAGNTFGIACRTYPEAFVYLCHNQLTGTWLGSTPELLLSGAKNHWQTVALAGTKKIDKRKTAWDEKNIREQQIVSAYLEKQLRIKDLVCNISEPYTYKTGRLMHLKTDFHFDMPDESHIGDLLDFLHPTPAVCGYPKLEASRLILAHEGYDRSYYSGFIGPLGIKNKTHLFVNLRCMEIGSEVLTLFAGGGLMPDSELESEWEETEEKLQTMLSLIES